MTANKEATVETKTLIQKQKQRMLGIDAFRILATFLIFFGHHCQLIVGGDGFIQSFTDPQLVAYFVPQVVPIFIMVSGFFALGKKVQENEPKAAIKSSWRYLRFWLIWTLFTLVIAYFYSNFTDGANSAYSVLRGLTAKEIFIGVIDTIFLGQFNSPIAGFSGPVAVMYFIMGLAGLMLLVPVFKPMFQTAHIKTVRFGVGVFTFFTLVVPTVKSYASIGLTYFPESSILSALSHFSPLTTWEMEWSCWWVTFFLLGGLLAVDTELRDYIRKLSWGKIMLVFIPMFLLNDALLYFGFNAGYCDAGRLPFTAACIAIIFKLNDTISADSKIGKAINTFSGDMLGVMALTVAFVYAPIAGGRIPELVAWYNGLVEATFPIAALIIAFAIHAVAFVAIVALVHYVLAKIPIVNKLVKF